MCFSSPSPPKDNSAELARQREAERQARITQGQQRIDEAFKGFDDPYYEKVSSDYGAFYEPQLTSQYQNAMQKLTTQLADQGNSGSSSGARQMGELRELYGKNQSSIKNSGLDVANNLRAQVNAQKSNLYQTNNSAADPSQAASLAGAAASAIAPPAYTPLGDIFSSVLKSTSNALGAEAAGFPGWRTGLFSNATSGRGSGKLVG